MKYRVCLGLALLLGGQPGASASADWISFEELQASCDALVTQHTDSNGSICRAFVHGYLVGFDQPRPASSPKANSTESESFSDRATRTRINDAFLKRVQSDGPPPFCLESGTELRDVVKTIAGYISAHPNAAELEKADAVHEALVKNFPCDA